MDCPHTHPSLNQPLRIGRETLSLQYGFLLHAFGLAPPTVSYIAPSASEKKSPEPLRNDPITAHDERSSWARSYTAWGDAVTLGSPLATFPSEE